MWRSTLNMVPTVSGPTHVREKRATPTHHADTEHLERLHNGSEVKLICRHADILTTATGEKWRAQHMFATHTLADCEGRRKSLRGKMAVKQRSTAGASVVAYSPEMSRNAMSSRCTEK